MGSQRRIRHKLFEWLRRYAPNEFAGWVGQAVNQRVRADMLVWVGGQDREDCALVRAGWCL
jgi:hypothetical protein